MLISVYNARHQVQLGSFTPIPIKTTAGSNNMSYVYSLRTQYHIVYDRHSFVMKMTKVFTVRNVEQVSDYSTHMQWKCIFLSLRALFSGFLVPFNLTVNL
jgi:hypothetical protein